MNRQKYVCLITDGGGEVAREQRAQASAGLDRLLFSPSCRHRGLGRGRDVAGVNEIVAAAAAAAVAEVVAAAVERRVVAEEFGRD